MLNETKLLGLNRDQDQYCSLETDRELNFDLQREVETNVLVSMPVWSRI